MTGAAPDDDARGGRGLEPGRELDRLIAERVFEWQVFGTPDLYAYWPEPYEGVKRLGDMPSLPHFSTSIAAAWLVVERMREQGWAVHMTDWAKAADRDDPVSGAVVVFNHPDRRTGRTNGEDSLTPLAICRAALTALGATARGEG